MKSVTSSLQKIFIVLIFSAITLPAYPILYPTGSSQTLAKKTEVIPIPGVDMQKIQNRLEVLKYHGRIWFNPPFSTFVYLFNVISASDYQTQKPADAFPFEAGFVTANGTITISEPITNEQKAVFPDLTSVALYYLNQAYIFHYYQTNQMPLIFKVGFPLFESGLLPSDATIKAAVNAYGGFLPSFDVLNNRAGFIANNGMAVAGVFAEFMNVFKNWGYPLITNINANGFDVAPWWFNVDNLPGLLGDFNRYLSHRLLQADDNFRIKLFRESDNFKFYTTPYFGNINFPMLTESMEEAYAEYTSHYNVKAGEKMSVFTLGDCVDADIEGLNCDPATANIGGTAWSSGLHAGCTANIAELNSVKFLMRHELAHLFQGLWKQESGTAWLGEGFAFFNAEGPLAGEYLGLSGFSYRPLLISSMDFATRYFGHRPTYADTKEYPQTDYGYKYLGYSMIDFMYRKGGYDAVKNVQINDTVGYKTLGYATSQAFFEDYLFDFDTRVQQMPVATLLNPATGTNESNQTVSINWVPLKSTIKLNVYVSTDEAKSWTKIADRTTDTSCTWNAGDIQGRFFIKISAPDNLGVSTTFGPFQKVNLSKLSLISPATNSYVITGDTAIIKWGITNVQNIKIDYSMNNGVDWTGIESGVSTVSGQYKWIVPTNISGACQLRITDLSNSSNLTTGEAFTVLQNNLVGGPYLMDKNTVLLLHFDNDLNNRSNLAPNAIGNPTSLATDAAGVGQLGRSYRTATPLTVPNSASLNLTGDWTIEAWIKLNSYNANNNMYLVWKPGDSDMYQSNYSLEVNPWWGNVFHGYYFSGLNSRIGQTSSSINLNEWYHVTFIRDTKAMKIKLMVHDRNRNQIFSGEQNYTSTETYLNARDLQIGTNLDGYIDEVRISNIARSFINTGINNQLGNRLTVYPNPSTGIVYLDGLQGIGQIRVSDANGRLLLTQPLSGKPTEKIDLTSFKKGVYFIQLKQEHTSQTNKVVIW